MQTARRFLPLFVCVVLLGLVFLIVSRVDEAQTIASLQVEFSPLPTPTPNPTPVGVSSEAALALGYIAAQESIPSEQLEVIGEEARDFLLLNRTYILVTLLYNQPEAPRQFQVWVDVNTKSVEADIADVFQAEQSAHAAKYGKLDTSLYERLQGMKDEETIAVAIWAVEASDEDSTRAAQDEVAQLYPEAAKALQEQGVAWAVDDPNLRLEIKAKYAEILTARTAQQVQPIVAWLQERGYEVQELPGAPIITATLAKEDILALADLPNVASIQFAGGAAESSSDISVPSSRIPTVWNRGFTGVGVRLGVIEGGKINSTARGCLNVIATRDNGQPDSLHKSRVAAIAACNNTTLPGVASGVQMLDASYPLGGSMTDAAFGLQWAVVQNLADVTNQSEVWESVTAPQYLDRYYDHLVRAYDFTAVIAVGNTWNSNGINVATPSKGWNVIGVGNVDDRNSAVWSGTGSGQDDIINSTSSWVNPSTGIEKPELAAPGTNINTVITPEDTGTSYAAPQVAGVAALLMQRASALKNFPSAVKAILMASAVHNVEGARQLSAKDGAGAIDAALADEVAQVQGGTSACNRPCWWNIAMQESDSGQPDTYLPVGGSLYRYFTATRGERIRVVISWMSAATSDGAQDDLRSNLDMKIKRPDNSVIASSVSSFNSEDGSHFETLTTGTLNPNATWTTAPSATFNGRGSAIVDGSEDLSVVVENIYDSGGRYLAAAYPGATTPATAVYVPFFVKKWPTLHATWRQTSELIIQNTGSQQASVTVTIYDSWDSDSGTASQSYTIPAGGRQRVPATDFAQVWDYGGFLAAARVSTTSGQLLAVVINTLTGSADGNGVITTPYLAGNYRAEGSPASFYYAPIAAKKYFGYDSSLQVQNASSNTTTFRIRFYNIDPTEPTVTLDNQSLGPYRSANYWRPPDMTDGFLGSATVEVLSGGPLAVMAQYDRFDTVNNRYGVNQYEGVSSLNSSLGMAHIQKTSPWTFTGIQAQNMNSNSVNIQLHYFQTAGGSAGSSVVKSNVSANRATNFWATPGEIPTDFNGSALGGVANLALLVNFDRLGDTSWQNKDGMMGYAVVK